jgi:hypothetical protein
VSSLLAVGLVAMLAVASAAGGRLLAAGILIVQLIFTLGAVRLAPVPASGRAAWLALAAGAAAGGWMAVAQIPELSPLAKVLGPVFLLTVLIQLARRDGRGEFNASLSLAVTACVLAVLSAAWVGLRFADGGEFAVALGLVGVGVAVLAEPMRVSATLRRLLAVLVAGGIAAGLVLLIGDLAAVVPAVGAVVIAAFGAVLAVVALAGVDRLADDPVRRNGGQSRPATSPELTAERGVASYLVPLRATLPIIAAGPVVYVLGRILVG